MPIQIAVEDARTTLVAGDTVRAIVTWQLGDVTKRVEANLYWQATGDGTTDSVIVVAATNDVGRPIDRWTVSLTIPADAPPTYAGQLLSVRWAVEARTADGRESAVLDLVVSPTGEALVPRRHN